MCPSLALMLRVSIRLRHWYSIFCELPKGRGKDNFRSPPGLVPLGKR